MIIVDADLKLNAERSFAGKNFVFYMWQFVEQPKNILFFIVKRL